MKFLDFFKHKLTHPLMKGLLFLGLLLTMGMAFAENKVDLVDNNMTLADNKITVTYVYSDHCQYCRIFESEVLEDSEVQSLLRKFEFKKVTPRATNPRVTVTPTVIIYQNNKIVKKWVPALSKRKFMDILREYQ